MSDQSQTNGLRHTLTQAGATGLPILATLFLLFGQLRSDNDDIHQRLRQAERDRDRTEQRLREIQADVDRLERHTRNIANKER